MKRWKNRVWDREGKRVSTKDRSRQARIKSVALVPEIWILNLQKSYLVVKLE